ncbi:transglycosylase SLT domain-containing protein [Azospirillum sp. sgz301742]
MRRVKSLLACAVLSTLAAACAGGPSRTASPAEIDAHVVEASKRFNMPETWIREVIRQESGGRTTMNGRPIVSKAGAMGLMQLMPATYEEMRRKHGLGSDPFEPRDNILAGTAYLREMYNLFGSPGFLGAYNCGPGCYGDYLAGHRTLPNETKQYLASVGPRLNGTPKQDNSDIVIASVPPVSPIAAPVAAPVALAPIPMAAAPRVPAPEALPVIVSAPLPAPASTPLRVADADRFWTVQLGAFRSADDGARVIDRARRSLPGMLDRTQRIVQAVDTKTGPLYRARLSGLSQQDAASTCASLVGQGMACFVVAPGA